ncbi:MAG TPA: hypothetical protein VNF27_00440 [Candidatus Binataceae bacterium]|nr:hypothetical protein [Candidatus Binataceae bacterium]
MADYRKSARRSERKSLQSIAAAVCAIALFGLGAPQFARAEDPAPDDWEPAEQVLEIPQACIPDGVVMTCDSPPPASASGTSVMIDVPDGADPAADPSAQPTAADSANIDEASSDPSLGNLQDYENQGIVEAPIAPIYTAGAETVGPIGSSTYFVPAAPIVLRPIPPLAIARPFGPGPWMIPPRYNSHPAGMRFRGGIRPFRVR